MKYLKEIKKSILVTDLIYIIIGIIMAIIPGILSNFICYIMGIIIVLFGTNRILKYIELKNKTNLSNIILVVGITALILGIIIIVNPERVASIIPFIIGIYVFVLGLSKVNQAMEFKGNNYSGWSPTMISAVLLLLLGIIVIFNPFETLTLVIKLVGIALIINSLYDLYNVYNYNKGFKDIKKDINKLFK